MIRLDAGQIEVVDDAMVEILKRTRNGTIRKSQGKWQRDFFMGPYELLEKVVAGRNRIRA